MDILHYTRNLVVTDSSGSFNAEFCYCLLPSACTHFDHAVAVKIHSPFQKRFEHTFKENNTIRDNYDRIWNYIWAKERKIHMQSKMRAA